MILFARRSLAQGSQMLGAAVTGLFRSSWSRGWWPERGLCSTGQLASSLEAWEGRELPLEQASTPPSSWYTCPQVLQQELATVFNRSWQVLGHASRLTQPGHFFTGHVQPAAPFLACRDQQGGLRAFHNVCRHHAAAVAAGSGAASCFRCPYHGWQYGLDGRLQKAVGLKGVEQFRAAENGLVPLRAATLGPWLFGHLGGGGPEGVPELAAWLGEHGAAALQASGACREGMVHVASREYTLQCNWKVFVDNYLDGGYHVSVAHPDLAAGLDLGTYASSIHERLSIQTCRPKGGKERLAGGQEAAYIFIYPNLMINSYGPWIDTNLVVPLTANTCKVVFEYYLEPELGGDEGFVAASLAASDQVQQEDILLCESVQQGLTSPAYDTGRYAPRFEAPMYHFHRLLDRDLHTAAVEEAHGGET